MKRVLIVDDCEEFREVVSDFLADAGYEVVVAQGGEEALDVCEGSHFDVILCDLVLPCQDQSIYEDESDSAMVGVHLIHTLSHKLPEIPIVAISGQMTGPALQGISQFGAVKCLAKPFSQKDLLAAVEAVMQLDQVQAAE